MKPVAPHEGTGGDAVVSALQAAGVDVVFGVISVHNIPIYDAIARDGTIRTIAARSEGGAVSMADGYARASGRLGVAITSTGPGAGNAAGALVEAAAAGSPVLHITGQIPSAHLDRGKGFGHEAKDQLGMLRSLSKLAYRVGGTKVIAGTLLGAIEQALAPPAGPVSVEIPIDFQHASGLIPTISPRQAVLPAPSVEAVRQVARLLAAAARPLIWAGGGALGAAAELTELAERLGAGVLTGNAGRGVISEGHPLCVGNFPNTAAVKELVESADLLLGVGTHFRATETRGWRLPLPETLIQIDADPAAIGRTYPAVAGIVGDARIVLRALLAELPGGRETERAWSTTVADCRRAARAEARSTLGPYERIADDLRAVLPRNGVLVRDVTVPASTWGHRLVEIVEPRTSIHAASAGIGLGLATAIGAKVACPERPVVLMCGDGGFMVSPGELATAVQENAPVVVLLFDDGGYGVLRNVQDAQFAGRRIGVDLRQPDFVRLAEAFGAWSGWVNSAEGFGGVLESALHAGRTAVVHIDMARVGPMLAPHTGPPRVAG